MLLLPTAPPNPSVGTMCPRLPPPELLSQAAVCPEVQGCGSPSLSTRHPEPAWWRTDGSLLHTVGSGEGEDASGQWPHLEASGDRFVLWLVFLWEPHFGTRQDTEVLMPTLADMRDRGWWLFDGTPATNAAPGLPAGPAGEGEATIMDTMCDLAETPILGRVLLFDPE